MPGEIATGGGVQPQGNGSLVVTGTGPTAVSVGTQQGWTGSVANTTPNGIAGGTVYAVCVPVS
jgi:hypothetical protein